MPPETQIIAVVGALVLIPILVVLHRRFARRYLGPLIRNDMFGFDDDD